uniref:Uncharacterized protein n=1 Tax=Meloidogyne javanica TaxID=6303 RepID=A0A915M167_MELJA
MEGLSEEKQDEEEYFLVNYLTDDEKSDRNEIQHHWPITSLVNRANEAIKHIIRPNQERRQLYSDDEEEREWTRQRRNVRQNDRDTYEPEVIIRQEPSQTSISSMNALKVDSVRLPTCTGGC